MAVTAVAYLGGDAAAGKSADVTALIARAQTEFTAAEAEADVCPTVAGTPEQIRAAAQCLDRVLVDAQFLADARDAGRAYAAFMRARGAEASGSGLYAIRLKGDLEKLHMHGPEFCGVFKIDCVEFRKAWGDMERSHPIFN